eukprot:sb/3478809/
MAGINRNKKTTNQNSLFRSFYWLSANQGPIFPDSVGSWDMKQELLHYVFIMRGFPALNGVVAMVTKAVAMVTKIVAMVTETVAMVTKPVAIMVTKAVA